MLAGSRRRNRLDGPPLRRVGFLGSQLRLLAVTAFVSALLTSTTAFASSNDLASLAAERRALQQQADTVLSGRGSTLGQLIDAEAHVAALKADLARNSARLAEIESDQGRLQSDIRDLEARLHTDRTDIGGLAREQYKTRAYTSLSQIVFGSSDLGQALNRVAAAERIGKRAHALAASLQSEAQVLVEKSAALADRHDEARRLHAQLAAQEDQYRSEASQYQARVNSIDSTAGNLLERVRRLDAQIALLTHPPTGGYTQSQQAIIAIIRAAADRHGVSGDQMVRVARCESGLNPRAYNRYSGASGLFQFMPGTFYGHGGHDIWDPSDQSEVAAKMFAQGQSGQWTCR